MVMFFDILEGTIAVAKDAISSLFILLLLIGW